MRVLRELVRHGGELSIPVLVTATKLSKEAVRTLVQGDLSAVGIVERLGTGRIALYRVRADHPMRNALDRLFDEEEAHSRRMFAALLEAAGSATPDALAVWMYGSVARGEDGPGSDLDVVVVLPEEGLDAAIQRYRSALALQLDREMVHLSVIGLSMGDVQRLVEANDPWWRNLNADAIPILGPPPAMLWLRLQAASNKGRESAA